MGLISTGQFCIKRLKNWFDKKNIIIKDKNISLDISNWRVHFDVKFERINATLNWRFQGWRLPRNKPRFSWQNWASFSMQNVAITRKRTILLTSFLFTTFWFTDRKIAGNLSTQVTNTFHKLVLDDFSKMVTWYFIRNQHPLAQDCT